MDDNQRDRSSGWKHAKLSGHENEKLIADLTTNNKTIQKRLLDAAHMSSYSIIDVQYGGLFETDVNSVLGGKTKSKSDMWLILSNGKRLNVSIKKDESGQVFLIGIERFLTGFENQYKRIIPEKVKRAINLYFGSAKDTLDIIHKFGSQNKKLEIRKHRLVADTLNSYNPELYQCLLVWFEKNIEELFDFCFAKGLASEEKDWVQIVWYKNLVGENQFDTIFNVRDVASRLKKSVTYGSKNGGSTIQLPFGFVQWHSPQKTVPGNLQFHHSYQKLIMLIKDYVNGSF